MELTNKYLREEYNVGNWVTYEKLLNDYYGEKFSKCETCQLCIPEDAGVCAGRYYGKSIVTFTEKQVEDCNDWKINIFQFMQLGESNKYPELNEYLNRPWL